MKVLFATAFFLIGSSVLGQGFPFVQFNTVFGPGDDEVKEFSIADDGTKVFIGDGRKLVLSSNDHPTFSYSYYDFFGILQDDGTSWRHDLQRLDIYGFSALNDQKVVLSTGNGSLGLGDLPGPHYYNRSVVQMSNDSTIDWKFNFYGGLNKTQAIENYVYQLDNGNILFAGVFDTFSYWGANAFHRNRTHLVILELDAQGQLVNHSSFPVEGNVHDFKGIVLNGGFFSFVFYFDGHEMSLNSELIKGELKHNLVFFRYHHLSKTGYSRLAASLDSRPFFSYLHHSFDGHLFIGAYSDAHKVKYGSKVKYNYPSHEFRTIWVISINSLDEPVACEPIVLSQTGYHSGFASHPSGNIIIFLSRLYPNFRLLGDHTFNLPVENHKHFGQLIVSSDLTFLSFEPIGSIPAGGTATWNMAQWNKRIYVLGCENLYQNFNAFGLSIPPNTYNEGTNFPHWSMESFVAVFEQASSLAKAEDEFGLIELYPNPSTDYVYVDSHVSGVISISVLDLNGRIVLRTRTADKHHKVILDGLDSGSYIFNMEFEDGSSYSKNIVIQ